MPAPGVLWAILLGFGLGMTFTLLLTLPTDLSHDPREVGGASALMLLVGYLLAALAPSVLGAVRDATGEFGPAIWLLVGIAVVMIPLSWSLTPLRIHGHARAGLERLDRGRHEGPAAREHRLAAVPLPKRVVAGHRGPVHAAASGSLKWPVTAYRPGGVSASSP